MKSIKPLLCQYLLHIYLAYKLNVQLKTRVSLAAYKQARKKQQKKDVFKIHPHHAYISIQNEIINFN